jgi:hypothetical protein
MDEPAVVDSADLKRLRKQFRHLKPSVGPREACTHQWMIDGEDLPRFLFFNPLCYQWDKAAEPEDKKDHSKRKQSKGKDDSKESKGKGQQVRKRLAVALAETLDLEPFLQKPLPLGRTAIYDLVDIIVHSGAVEGGHYTIYNNIGNGQWCVQSVLCLDVSEAEMFGVCRQYINDSKVTPVSSRTVALAVQGRSGGLATGSMQGSADTIQFTSSVFHFGRFVFVCPAKILTTTLAKIECAINGQFCSFPILLNPFVARKLMPWS